MPLDSKHTEASFSPNSTYSLCLQLTQMPRSPDVAIFVSITTTTTTQPITLPFVHVCGVIKKIQPRCPAKVKPRLSEPRLSELRSQAKSPGQSTNIGNDIDMRMCSRVQCSHCLLVYS